MPATPKQILQTYWRALGRYRLAAVALWIGISGGVASSVLSPVLYKRFFDILTEATGTNVAPRLIRIVFEVLALNVAGWIFWRAATFLHNFLESRVMTDLRQDSFNYLLRHSYRFFADNFGGSLVQKVNRLARGFEVFFDSLNWNLLPLMLRIVGVLVIIWIYNAFIGMILLGWMILFLLVNFLLSQWKIKYDLSVAEQDSKTTGVLADAITNHSNIQLFASFPRESGIYRDASELQRRLTKLAWDLDSVIEAIQAFLMFVVEFVIFYFAVRYWQRGLLSVGTFVLLQAYLLQLVGQLWDFGRTVRNIYRSLADSEEMVTILNKPHEIQDVPGATELRVTVGKVEFRNVEFSFHLTRKVLRNVDLVVRGGEKVALIGPSGAGKSTIVKLLLRLYELESGAILVDGQDIHTVTQASLWSNISLVPQDPILFHRTLFENIRYGQPGASQEEVEQAARMAHCDDFIELLPERYNTFVGERGIKLSGGERQRVAIARAILKNAPILILDEATSSLDSHSEVLIQDALKRLMEGKTAIVIAHRLSTIQAMDRIVVIDDGQVKEQGAHAELLANSGSLYRHLWQIQAGGFLQPEEKDRLTALVETKEAEQAT